MNLRAIASILILANFAATENLEAAQPVKFGRARVSQKKEEAKRKRAEARRCCAPQNMAPSTEKASPSPSPAKPERPRIPGFMFGAPIRININGMPVQVALPELSFNYAFNAKDFGRSYEASFENGDITADDYMAIAEIAEKQGLTYAQGYYKNALALNRFERYFGRLLSDFRTHLLRSEPPRAVNQLEYMSRTMQSIMDRGYSFKNGFDITEYTAMVVNKHGNLLELLEKTGQADAEFLKGQREKLDEMKAKLSKASPASTQRVIRDLAGIVEADEIYKVLRSMYADQDSKGLCTTASLQGLIDYTVNLIDLFAIGYRDGLLMFRNVKDIRNLSTMVEIAMKDKGSGFGLTELGKLYLNANNPDTKFKDLDDLTKLKKYIAKRSEDYRRQLYDIRAKINQGKRISKAKQNVLNAIREYRNLGLVSRFRATEMIAEIKRSKSYPQATRIKVLGGVTGKLLDSLDEINSGLEVENPAREFDNIPPFDVPTTIDGRPILMNS